MWFLFARKLSHLTWYLARYGGEFVPALPSTSLHAATAEHILRRGMWKAPHAQHAPLSSRVTSSGACSDEINDSLVGPAYTKPGVCNFLTASFDLATSTIAVRRGYARIKASITSIRIIIL